MNIIPRMRLPYREDKITGLLAFLLFIVPLAFTVLTYENFETIKYALWMVLFGSAMLFFLRRSWKSDTGISEKSNRNFFYILFAFWSWSLISAIFSIDKLNSFFGFYYRFTGGVIFYSLFSGTVFLLLKVLDGGRLRFFAKILVFDSLAVSVGAIFQSFGWGFYAGPLAGGFLRAPSFLGNPNFSAMFIVAILPFSAVLFAESSKFRTKAYYALSAALALLATALLASRGAIVALLAEIMVGLICFSYIRLSGRVRVKIFLAAFLSLLLCLFVVRMSRPQILNRDLNSRDQNVSLRLQVWRVTLKGLASRPLFGVGPGNFQIFFEQNRPSSMVGATGVFDDAHNLYLQLAATGGIPFAAIFLALVAMSAWSGFKNLRKEDGLWSLASLSGLAGFSVAALFTPVSVGCFLSLAALLAFLVFPSLKENKMYFPAILKTLCGVFAVFMVLFGLSLAVSEHLFLIGYQRYFQGAPQTTYRLSKIAKVMNPTDPLFDVYFLGSQIQMHNFSPSIISGIEKIDDLHPNQARTLVEQSNLYSLMYRQSGDAKYLQPAIDKLLAALKLDPFFPERYGQAALYYYQMGDLQSSLEYIDKSLSLSGDQFPAWMLKARIHQDLKDRDSSVLALEKAYKLRPDILQLKYILEFARTEPDISKVPIQMTVLSGKLE